MRGDKPGGPVRWRMHIAVAAERVFDALNSDEGRAAFWAESAVEVDGQIEFHFVNGHTSIAEIVDRQRPSLWTIDYFGGLVRFELSSDGPDRTDLFLINEGINLDEWHEVHAGWLNVLFPLKAWLTHGVDLRNHDVNRSWDDGYADQ